MYLVGETIFDFFKYTLKNMNLYKNSQCSYDLIEI